jgi:hypothetical protein
VEQELITLPTSLKYISKKETNLALQKVRQFLLH